MISISAGIVVTVKIAIGLSAQKDEHRDAPLKLAVGKSFPVEAAGQQGIATDGKHVFVQATHVLYKYDLKGKFLAKSEERRWHHGGILYHDGKIYAAVSECSRKGSDKHWVCVYDPTSLEKVNEYDIGKHFRVCAGGIAYFDHHFYVAESYYDNDHEDYVVQFDTEFRYVKAHRVKFKCPYGIQGLTYVPVEKSFVVASHGREFYRIDSEFQNHTIEPGRAPFDLQDVAHVKGSTYVVNERAAKRVVFAEIVE